MALRWVWLTLFGLVLALTGCAKKDSSASSLGAFEAEAMAPARGGYAAKRAPARARPPSPAPAMADGLSPSPDAGATMDEAPEPAQRMIAYSARTTVRVLRQRDAIDAITDAVAALGGFVERIDRSRVIVRVPVDTFEQGLAAVQAVGEVTDERIFAADVTESFQDVALRLDTATATRERLVELLARTEDANQKMALIREIQRLTDQIDTLTAQRETLLRLTSLSRITIDLVERQSLTDRRSASEEPSAFGWITRLQPFGDDVVREWDRLRLDAPDGMVELDERKSFVAEAPDGSRVWSGRHKVEVEGDATFWATAIQERVASEFASAEVRDAGTYRLIVLTSRDEEPYTWWVAVRQDGRHVEVVEATFTSPEALERYGDAVLAVLVDEGGEA